MWVSGGWKVGCFSDLFLEYLNECEFIEKSTLDCTCEVNLVPFRWLADFKSNFYCFTRSPLTFKNGRVSVEFSRLWWNDSDDFDIRQHSAHLELQISQSSCALLFFMARFWACQVVASFNAVVTCGRLQLTNQRAHIDLSTGNQLIAETARNQSSCGWFWRAGRYAP